MKSMRSELIAERKTLPTIKSRAGSNPVRPQFAYIKNTKFIH